MTSKTRASRMVAVLFGAALMAACGGGGGGDDAPAPSASAPSPGPAPAPAPGPAPAPAPAEAAFATPSSTTTTEQAGGVETYQFAENGAAQTAGTVTFASGAVSYGASLASAQAFAGAAVRLSAPNSAAFNASAYSQIKLQLRSSTDAVLLVKLQPSPVSADGCTATAQAMVSSTLSEIVIDLNSTSFPLPGHCATGTTVDALRAGLLAVDVVNPASTAGAHDVTVGSISLVP